MKYFTEALTCARIDLVAWIVHDHGQDVPMRTGCVQLPGPDACDQSQTGWEVLLARECLFAVVASSRWQ